MIALPRFPLRAILRSLIVLAVFLSATLQAVAFQVLDEGGFLFFHYPGTNEIQRYHKGSKAWFTKWVFSGEVFGITGRSGILYFQQGTTLYRREILTEKDSVIATEVPRSDLMLAGDSWILLISEETEGFINFSTRKTDTGELVDSTHVESRLFSYLTSNSGAPGGFYFYKGDFNQVRLCFQTVSGVGMLGDLEELADAPGAGDDYLFGSTGNLVGES
ncbi:MAG: hypothetical protein KJT03_15035 [Verrucomicrobiae bacterium]|nr:hypothetical protein [Verrucomicrobiae bacterium]